MMDSFSTKLGLFISEHENNYKDILTKEPYNLIITQEDNLILLKYNQIESDFDNEFVRESRGIIFRQGSWNVPVCHAFDKFGNYGEQYVPSIDWSTTAVTEKIDGSLIKVWYDTVTGWRVSTNGTIDAYKATYSDVENANFGRLFEEGLLRYNLTIHDLFRNLEPGFTYMFELVSPKTRVVIPYSETDVYFLGYRDNYTNTEFPFYVNRNLYNFEVLEKLNKPKVYSLSTLDDAIHAAENLPWDEEGYVACDTNGNRCKIKSPAYVVAHYCRNNDVITNKHLVNIILNGEQDEFLIYANEHKDELRKVENAMNNFKEQCRLHKSMFMQKDNSNRKLFAQQVLKCPKRVQGYLFNCYNKCLSINEYTKNWSADKWLRYIKEDL